MAEAKKSSKKRKKKPDIVIDEADVRDTTAGTSADGDTSSTASGPPSPRGEGKKQRAAKKKSQDEGKVRQRDERGRFVKGHSMEEGAGFEPGNLEASKYQEKFCADMLRFFDDVYAEGNYPTFEMFASAIDVTARTLENWAGVYPEFSDAYTACKNKQRGALLEGAMAGRFNATFAKFVAVNCHGMKEKVEGELKGSGGFKICVGYLEENEEEG